MLVFYFAGAVWAAGSAIASGLFVPMLLIGSCVGRIVGLMAVDFAAAGGRGSEKCMR
jgi:chloride channel 7